MKNYKKYLCWPVAMVTLLLIGHAVVAAGHGKGRTMIAFKTSTTDFTASSFFAKIDVSGAVTSNSNVTTTTGGTGTATNTDDGDDDDNQSGGNGHGNGHGKGSGKVNGNGNGKGKGHGKSALSNGNGHTANGFNNFSLAGFDVTLTIGSASFTGTADGKGKVHDPFDAKLTANGQILMINASGWDLVELFPLDTTDREPPGDGHDQCQRVQDDDRYDRRDEHDHHRSEHAGRHVLLQREERSCAGQEFLRAITAEARGDGKEICRWRSQIALP